MAKILDYYGDSTQDMLTYLEFGAIDISQEYKRIWGFLLHQDAYDFYMISRYLRDIFLYRDVSQSVTPSPKLLHEKNQASAHKDLLSLILKYAAICTARELNWHSELRLCELGSTIFGLIDEMQAMASAMAQTDMIGYLADGCYSGIEISALMNRSAKELHPGYKIVTETDFAQFLNSPTAYDIFYGLSISFQYALKSMEDLDTICQNAKLSLLNRFMFSSQEEDRRIKLGTGKYGYNISLKRLLQILRGSEQVLYYQPATLVQHEPGFQPGSMIAENDRSIQGCFVLTSPEVMAVFERHYAEILSQFSIAHLPQPQADLAHWKPAYQLIESLNL